MAWVDANGHGPQEVACTEPLWVLRDAGWALGAARPSCPAASQLLRRCLLLLAARQLPLPLAALLLTSLTSLPQLPHPAPGCVTLPVPVPGPCPLAHQPGEPALDPVPVLPRECTDMEMIWTKTC